MIEVINQIMEEFLSSFPPPLSSPLSSVFVSSFLYLLFSCWFAITNSYRRIGGEIQLDEVWFQNTSSSI